MAAEPQTWPGHYQCGLCRLCVAHFVGPFLKGGALAPSPRVLGDVAFCWTTTELDRPRGPAANCVEPRRRYGEVGQCASGSVPRCMTKDSTFVTTLA